MKGVKCSHTRTHKHTYKIFSGSENLVLGRASYTSRQTARAQHFYLTYIDLNSSLTVQRSQSYAGASTFHD